MHGQQNIKTFVLFKFVYPIPTCW